MGWDNTAHEPARTSPVRAIGAVNAAAALCAAQLPAAGLAVYVATSGGDDYGAGYGGGLAALGFLCMAVFAPPALFLVGGIHAAAYTMPAAGLARLALRRLGGREWAWHLGFVALLGALWASPAALYGGRTWLVAAALITLSGVLPVLGAAYLRGRARTPARTWGVWGIWWRAGVAAFGLVLVVAAGGVAASVTGLVGTYEPPVLSAREVAGVWRGDDGAELRLRPDGRVEFTDLPTEPASGDLGRKDLTTCDGTGNWLLDRDGRHDAYLEEGPAERDGVLVRARGRCGRDTFWTIGGTEAEPELFVLFGDPDAGELRILTRRGDA